MSEKLNQSNNEQERDSTHGETADFSKREESKTIEEKEWNDFLEKFTDLRNTVLNKIFAIEDKQWQDYFWQKIDEQREKIFSAFKDRSKYLAYHIEVSGSTSYKSSPKMDFDGEYSLYEFYKGLLRKLNIK